MKKPRSELWNLKGIGTDVTKLKGLSVDYTDMITWKHRCFEAKRHMPGGYRNGTELMDKRSSGTLKNRNVQDETTRQYRGNLAGNGTRAPARCMWVGRMRRHFSQRCDEAFEGLVLNPGELRLSPIEGFAEEEIRRLPSELDNGHRFPSYAVWFNHTACYVYGTHEPSMQSNAGKIRDFLYDDVLTIPRTRKELEEHLKDNIELLKERGVVCKIAQNAEFWDSGVTVPRAPILALYLKEARFHAYCDASKKGFGRCVDAATEREKVDFYAFTPLPPVGKAIVVADALSQDQSEREPPLRVRALVMTISPLKCCLVQTLDIVYGIPSPNDGQVIEDNSNSRRYAAWPVHRSTWKGDERLESGINADSPEHVEQSS
ncbi:hypothetical protein Tco_1121583 [Tanacetum coccineum]|uniref:Uncharacterized protein n=1 Tax=Tanacetum coccineum TaxID=301880 RepID=A0ABQ5IY36_9ASTR